MSFVMSVSVSSLLACTSTSVEPITPDELSLLSVPGFEAGEED